MSYRENHPRYKNTNDASSLSGVNFDGLTVDQLKKLWLETLKSGMHGICFSLYEDGQQPGDIITPDQVRRRLNILKPYTKWIRSFSCIEGNEHIPVIAKELGMKTMVGAWLGKDLELNEKEIDGLIDLANKGMVDIAAVGNEVLYRNDLNEGELLDYIYTVKESLPHITVGYVDAYYEFSQHPKITEACDVILSNCYPYWEGTALPYSLNHMQHMYNQAKESANGKKVIITETGWPSQGSSQKEAESSAENAIKYFINSISWAKKQDIELFYFSSFDESWKTGDEGDVGAYWGLWDKHEQLKF